jgi:hypothetical protein
MNHLEIVILEKLIQTSLEQTLNIRSWRINEALNSFAIEKLRAINYVEIFMLQCWYSSQQSRRQNDEFQRKVSFSFHSLYKFLLLKMPLREKSTQSSAIWFYRINAHSLNCVWSRKINGFITGCDEKRTSHLYLCYETYQMMHDRGHEKWYYCLWLTICHFQLLPRNSASITNLMKP